MDRKDCPVLHIT